MWGETDWWKGIQSKNGANALIGLGTGLLSGKTFAEGLGLGGQEYMKGAQLDQQYADEASEEEKRIAQINQTAAFLREKGAEDLAAAVEGGMTTGADAFNQWYQQSTAKPNLTADMQNFQFAQSNPEFAEFLGAGEAPTIVETYDPETGQPVKGYMQGGNFVPVGGPKMPSARDNPMNSTIMKELFEADETIQAGQAVITGLDRALELNDVAYDGPWADQRSYVASLAGDQGGIATQELKNVVTAQALESLKAVFGGMPTEGERKILLEIQGSVDQPKPVREAIYKRARVAAERRIAENAAKAAALRNGSYFEGGYSAQSGAPAANTTSTGLQWSIE